MRQSISILSRVWSSITSPSPSPLFHLFSQDLMFLMVSSKTASVLGLDLAVELVFMRCFVGKVGAYNSDWDKLCRFMVMASSSWRPNTPSFLFTCQERPGQTPDFSLLCNTSPFQPSHLLGAKPPFPIRPPPSLRKRRKLQIVNLR